MSDILIRDVPEDIVFKLDELVKKSGAKSRNDFLKRQLELMSSLEELKRIEGNYSYLIKKLGKIIEYNSALMEVLAEEILGENIGDIISKRSKSIWEE
ncbi:conserved hypothetical protein [Clostridium perfringens D str. JGS1721]|uniref:Ribbon-helix-helix protein CopG domain-containing protein n=1 Tax=Clostridium perfringens D str. JGS1721 TaxID=488537 RepID=B1V6Y5_CLOPF|nr:hypothetical protein [Clostridium perfringens]EDT69978.1 conserved hypothetical protein [Clostridium perfringens D str. JGS1721]EDT69985.1 conserved hypothetical protein [Clostridium perfringens D str. JGS1721]EDT70190.1 conserved hypothetical protein [Clostridium perfringens D str. JGS1721]EDT70394.1 conserved hypothetical protein [Clostridium perfringens D str. JGS1721]EDT70424.1 conserved hypothetical protein [Clostridium perfringens D str. JGS1721]